MRSYLSLTVLGMICDSRKEEDDVKVAVLLKE